MSILSGVYDFFGLDIGTDAVRLVQLRGKGPLKSLVKYAYVPVDYKLVMSDAKADQLKLQEVLKQLINESNLTTKNAAVSLPSSKVFTTVIDIDKLSPSELDKTIKYQADTFIPTPVSDSKIDWQILGPSPKEKNKVEVLISSVTNEFVESRLEMLEAVGIEVIAFEPESVALSRAIMPADATAPQMVLGMGDKTTDLIIIMGGAPRLIRALPSGSDTIVRAAMQNLSVDEKQARQFVTKFGLSKDKLDGQVYHAIIGSIELLMGEVEKSIKFFQTRYGETPLERIIVTGDAASLPELPLYIANKYGISVEIGNAWRNVAFPPERQNELLALSARFGVAAGLAERME